VSLPIRTEAQLRQRQERGQLTVRAAAEFRNLVEKTSLEEAYAHTDVVVAADACFTDQASLHVGLGPTDPPIRLRAAQLAGVSASCGHGSTDFMLPMGGGLAEPARHGGAQVLGALLAGQAFPSRPLATERSSIPAGNSTPSSAWSASPPGACCCTGALAKTGWWPPAAPKA